MFSSKGHYWEDSKAGRQISITLKNVRKAHNDNTPCVNLPNVRVEWPLLCNKTENRCYSAATNNLLFGIDHFMFVMEGIGVRILLGCRKVSDDH